MFSDLSLTLGEDQFVDSHSSLAELACQGTVNRGRCDTGSGRCHRLELGRGWPCPRRTFRAVTASSHIGAVAMTPEPTSG